MTDVAISALQENLGPQDLERWAAFLPTVRVGGALPGMFWIDGAFVVVEVTVPYVAPERAEPTDRWIDTPAGQRIPLAIADDFPVPVSGRYRLPAFSPDNAVHFLRHLVREIYHHEIDEQLRVGDSRPFAPNHD